jgi:hypothetical protein
VIALLKLFFDDDAMDIAAKVDNNWNLFDTNGDGSVDQTEFVAVLSYIRAIYDESHS